jgi:hypothetical protein
MEIGQRLAQRESQQPRGAGQANRASAPINALGLKLKGAEVLDRWPSAGLAVALVRDGTREWSFGHGVADGQVLMVGTRRRRLRPHSSVAGSASRIRRSGPTSPPSAQSSDGPPLAAVKLVHTFAWFSIESCMIYVLWTGFIRRSDRRVAVAAGVVTSESLIFAANGFRCPLTQVAERVGAERGSVTDIYLPYWFAHNLPAIHVPLIMLAGYLHGRNLRRQ